MLRSFITNNIQGDGNEMSKTEKITVNLNVVDLGKIDLLVDQGLYSNRTDFMKTAVRNQIVTHGDVIDQVMTESAFSIGISGYNKNDLEKLLVASKQLDITQIGMLTIADDVTKQLALQTINSIKVRGVFKAPEEVAKALEFRIH